MLVDGGGNFRARQRVELVQKENCRTSVFTAAAFGTQLVADFSAGNQDAASVLHFPVGNQREEARVRKFLDFGTSIGMAQHNLGREDDQRLWPPAGGPS